MMCSTIKRRGDRFDSDEQLTSWLDEDGVSYTPGRLSAAMLQLERIGRLNRPRQDHWRPDLPLPGVYVDPRVYPNDRPAPESCQVRARPAGGARP
jgi:hypothetical protein